MPSCIKEDALQASIRQADSAGDTQFMDMHSWEKTCVMLDLLCLPSDGGGKGRLPLHGLSSMLLAPGKAMRGALQLRAAARVQGKKGKKIKQGAAQEEAALHQHILQLAPTQAHLQQMGQLAELLILFGQFEAAKTLQAALGRLQAASAEASVWLLEHPVQEVQQQQQQQGLQARQQSTPEVQWKWHVLKDL